MENSADVCKKSIEEAIKEAKKTSYDGVIKNSYEKYKMDGDEVKMYNTISSYLTSTYKYSDVISNIILLFNEKTDMEYYTYSNVAGSTYSNINEFKRNAALAVKMGARELGTETKLVYISGHLYIVRNIVTSNFKPFTTVVMEVNTSAVLKNLENVVWTKGHIVYIDQAVIDKTENLSNRDVKIMNRFAKQFVDPKAKLTNTETEWTYESKSTLTRFSVMVNNQKLTAIIKLDKDTIQNERRIFIVMYVIIFLLLIPLLIATFYFFFNNITKPVNMLMEASNKIENGEYGYKIDEFNRNKEMGKLIDTFNHMSVGLHDSFNRIYAEEVAVRDANMKALQSQINPHYLNNTLEIINWKARLGGNDDVSDMISALSTMMNATLDRNNEPFITIEEEMTYIDAYLFIIRQRFGEKFKFELDIDENLLNIRIPRLIIQPLVENAVEYGGDKMGKREGSLKIYDDKDNLYIVVENNGTLSKSEEEKIISLLNDDGTYDIESRKSIGIRNVNTRIKIIYGEDSGLTIKNKDETKTISIITIKKDNVARKDKTEQ